MAGPTTEVLNEDIKELKTEIKEFKSDVRHDLDLLREDFHKVALGVAELRGELRVTLGVARWAGALLVTTLLTSGIAGIWWASGINTKVDGLGARILEESEAINARISNLEASMNKVLEQTRPSQAATKTESGAGTPGK